MSKTIIAAAIGLMLTAMPLLANNGYKFSIDASASSVDAKVSFLGLGHKKAQFPVISGTVAMPNAAGSKIDLDVKIDAARLTSSDKDTTKQLKGRDFFNVAKFPTVTFDGNSIVMNGATKGVVSGNLTACGVTKPVKLAVTFSKAPAMTNGRENIMLTGTTTINRRDFGMTAYSVIVGKKVTITIKSRLTPG